MRGKHRRPVHPHPVHISLGQGGDKASPVALTAAQRPQHRRRCITGCFRGFGHGRRQDRVRAHLNKGATPLVQQQPGSVGESHRLAQIAIPVASVKRVGLQQRTGHRRIERNMAGARRDGRELGDQPIFDRFDVQRMRSVIDRDQPRENPCRLTLGDEFFQYRSLTGDYRCSRAVDRSHRKLSVPRNQALEHRFGRQPHRCHAAGVTHFRDRPAA
uniref:Uncharacterized protein n=1 Tax=Mycobacterium riyadhense TaxID=486698 RepID=A0A653F462_9MYCO|nr:hypothetical protein BIN_B_05264 [Mycobacterium riyadhense]